MNQADHDFAQRVEEAFIQLGPAGQLTIYQCMTCGATVSVVALLDGRPIHLKWHDALTKVIDAHSAGFGVLAKHLEDA